MGYAVKLGKKEIMSCAPLYTVTFASYSAAYYSGITFKNEVTGQITNYGTQYYSNTLNFLTNDSHYYIQFSSHYLTYYAKDDAQDRYTAFMKSDNGGSADHTKWYRTNGYFTYVPSLIPNFYLKVFEYKGKNPPFEDYLS